jgi:hypothetical protein
VDRQVYFADVVLQMDAKFLGKLFILMPGAKDRVRGRMGQAFDRHFQSFRGGGNK